MNTERIWVGIGFAQFGLAALWLLDASWLQALNNACQGVICLYVASLLRERAK